jgi:hypothetical protein
MRRFFWRLRLGQIVVTALVTAVLLAGLATAGATVRVAPAWTTTPDRASSPAAQDQYRRRITICHRSGRNLRRSRYRTIRIARRSLRGHLRHGDGIGRCSRARFTICHKVRKRGKVVGRRTLRVRGSRAHRRHMRHGDRIRACPRKRKRTRR